MKKYSKSILISLSIICFISGILYFSFKEKIFSNNNISYIECQLKKPSKNEEIAVMFTNMGKIKIRLFSKNAPKAVENFKSLSSNGYYNNIIFHRVINDFMIQSGDPTGTGRGGESIWKKSFEDEFSENLFNITGSLSMANCGPDTNGSQFFINFQNPKNFSGWNQYENYYEKYKQNPKMYKKVIDMSKITENIKKLYLEKGGNPFLDGYYSTDNQGHTVFGQVFEGLDIIEKISKTETDSNDKPISEIKIEKIVIEKYN